MVLAVHRDEETSVSQLLDEYRLPREKVGITAGGPERQDSVYRALQELETEWVLVHDAVRPFVTHEQISELLVQAKRVGAAVLAVPVKDTIKEVTPRFGCDWHPGAKPSVGGANPSGFPPFLVGTSP